MEHYRKVGPQTVPLTFQNVPGLFRIDPKPGAVVHDPLPDGNDWAQGAASGTLDFTPNAVAITHQQAGAGGFVVTVRRGPAGSPRQSIVELWAIDANELIATTPSKTITYDEFSGSSHKNGMVVSPDNLKVCLIERDPGNDPIFVVVNLDGSGGLLGSVAATGMTDTNTGFEGVWIGDHVYVPESAAGGSIFVFNVSDPANPTLEDEFVTSAAGSISSCVGSKDGNSLYCVEGDTTQIFIALDITDPSAITEDDTQVHTGTYQSLALDINSSFADPQLIAFHRADASNVRYARLPVTGTTFGTLDEDTRALSTGAMGGWTVIYDTDTVIMVSARTAVSPVNSLRAHIFKVDPVSGVTFTETLSYNHGISGNKDNARSIAGKRLVFWFGFTTDAEVTFGKLQFSKVVPLTIDCPLRFGFGGTGLAAADKGDLLYAGRALPDNQRGFGELTRLEIGDEGQHLVVSGELPVWQDEVASLTTVDFVSNVAQDVILGRVSSGSGDSEELTPAQVRTLINVEDGAAADQTAADIRGLGFFDTTNDGAGSGLDADFLDGNHAAAFVLLAGRSPAQTIIGGTAASQSLTLQSTSDPTLGKIVFAGTVGGAYNCALDRLGIGTQNPIVPFHIVTDGAATVTIYDSYFTGIGGPQIIGRHSRGSLASPVVSSINDWLVAMTGRGRQSAGAWSGDRVRIVCHAGQVFSLTNQGTYISFSTTPLGSTTIAERVRIDPAGNLGIGVIAFGTSAAQVFAQEIGTAPASSPANMFQMYCADTVAGQANCYMRNEEGKSEQITGLKARVSTQFDKTSDVTPSAVTGLPRNVEAGKTYAFRAYLFLSASAGGGQRWTMDGSCTATAIRFHMLTIDAGDTGFFLNSQAAALGTEAVAAGSIDGVTIIEGLITVNAAGTLAPFFAQSSSDASPSSILVGSIFELIPIGN